MLAILTAVSIFAQNNKDEAEILKIHKGLDQAFVNQNATYFESVFADDYIYSREFGIRDERKQFFR